MDTKCVCVSLIFIMRKSFKDTFCSPNALLEISLFLLLYPIPV